MPRPPALLASPGAGRLDPAFLGVRLGDGTAVATAPLLRGASFDAGANAIGPLEIALRVRAEATSALLEPVLRNTSGRLIHVEAIVACAMAGSRGR